MPDMVVEREMEVEKKSVLILDRPITIRSIMGEAEKNHVSYSWVNIFFVTRFVVGLTNICSPG